MTKEGLIVCIILNLPASFIKIERNKGEKDDHSSGRKYQENKRIGEFSDARVRLPLRGMPKKKQMKSTAETRFC